MSVTGVSSVQPRIFAPAKNISFSGKKVSRENVEAKGEKLHTFKKGNEQIIANAEGEMIAKIKISPEYKGLKVTADEAKFAPELNITHPKLGDTTVKMFAGSSLKSKDGKLSIEMFPESKKKLSFGASKFAVTTNNNGNETTKAVQAYINNLTGHTIDGSAKSTVIKNEPTLVIPAGGFGTRLANLTSVNGNNKPSLYMPTDGNYRIVANALNIAEASGFINGKTKPLYIHENQKDPLVQPAGERLNIVKGSDLNSDGGAILEALVKGKIPSNKDLVIVNADIFTNADLSNAYKLMKDKKAALVIPFYPVNETRAKSFGLISFDKVGEGKNRELQIKGFTEKPQVITDEIKEHCGVDGKYAANPGMYFISKEALPFVKELFKKDEAAREANPDEKSKTLLGKNIMPELIKAINEGKIKGADGKAMKAYTTSLKNPSGNTAVWDDIGTAKAYLDVIKDVATEYKAGRTGKNGKYYGVNPKVMEDFAGNYDEKSGVVYLSSKAREDFNAFTAGADKNGSPIEAKGNIFVMDKKA